MHLNLDHIIIIFCKAEQMLDGTTGITVPAVVGSAEGAHVGHDPRPEESFSPSLDAEGSEQPLHLHITLPNLHFPKLSRAAQRQGFLEHQARLVMETAGDDLGHVGKVRSEAMGESSREEGIGVVETAHLSGIVDMVLLDVGLDLLVILQPCKLVILQDG